MFPAPLTARSVNSTPIVNGKRQIPTEKSTPSPIENNRKRAKIPKKRLVELLETRHRVPSRRSSFETISPKYSVVLPQSRSLDSLEDRICQERKAHTLPPLLKITEPSSNPQSKLFASVVAPSDVQPFKPIDLSYESLSSSSSSSSWSDTASDVESTDDEPVTVMVQCDLNSEFLPSEDAIRNVVNKLLCEQPSTIKKNEPIVLNLVGGNLQLQQQRGVQPITHKPPLPSIKILAHLSALPPIDPQRSHSYLSFFSAQHFMPAEYRHVPPPPKPFINRNKNQDRKMSQLYTDHESIIDLNLPPIDRIEMATEQVPSTVVVQQTISEKSQVITTSSKVFRPPAVTDIPELSQDNLLQMLNQIPDLHGRKFKIEYAPSSAPEGYPFPFNLDSTHNTYPEPVVIDKLPTNVIEQVQKSNNPALQAALHTTIQKEQHVGNTGQGTTNVQSSTVIHHVAQSHEQVQQSRSASSESSTDSSSSETSASSSEDSESEESESVANHLPIVG